jgi:hypothetical protein
LRPTEKSPELEQFELEIRGVKDDDLGKYANLVITLGTSEKDTLYGWVNQMVFLEGQDLEKHSIHCKIPWFLIYIANVTTSGVMIECEQAHFLKVAHYAKKGSTKEIWTVGLKFSGSKWNNRQKPTVDLFVYIH